MKRKVIPVIIFFTLAFIWGHSLVPRRASADESVFFLKILYPVLSVIVGKNGVTIHLVRKTAHFTEYFILGTEFRLYQNLRYSDTEAARAMTSDAGVACAMTSDAGTAWAMNSDADAACRMTSEKSHHIMKKICHLVHGRMLTAVRFAFYIAFIDETIQIFSGRGPQIADVWLDVLGAFCGAAIASLLSARPGRHGYIQWE